MITVTITMATWTNRGLTQPHHPDSFPPRSEIESAVLRATRLLGGESTRRVPVEHPCDIDEAGPEPAEWNLSPDPGHGLGRDGVSPDVAMTP